MWLAEVLLLIQQVSLEIGNQTEGDYEVATSAFGQYAGLRAAITYSSAMGSAERYQQICQLSQYLWQPLTELADISCLRIAPPQAGLVSFQVTNSSKPQAKPVN